MSIEKGVQRVTIKPEQFTATSWLGREAAYVQKKADLQNTKVELYANQTPDAYADQPFTPDLLTGRPELLTQQPESFKEQVTYIDEESAKLEIATKLGNAAQVQLNLQSILEGRGMSNAQAHNASVHYTLRVLQQTFTERGLLRYLPNSSDQPAKQDFLYAA